MSFLVTFTPGSSDDSALAKRCCDRFARARCGRSVNPVTLLAAIPPDLVTGATADATARVAEATDDADGEARVLAEWVTCGWIGEGEGAALQAERRTSGNALKQIFFAELAGRGPEAKLRAAMLLRLRGDSDQIGFASTGKTAPFHLDGTLPDFRDCRVNPLVAVDRDGARVLSFIEVMALRGYYPDLHNVATETIGNRCSLVANAVPAPIYVMALLAATTELANRGKAGRR